MLWYDGDGIVVVGGEGEEGGEKMNEAK